MRRRVRLKPWRRREQVAPQTFVNTIVNVPVGLRRVTVEYEFLEQLLYEAGYQPDEDENSTP